MNILFRCAAALTFLHLTLLFSPFFFQSHLLYQFFHSGFQLRDVDGHVVNTGDKPLVVQQAFGSCGCTVATPPKDPIAPGAKGVIKVSYNGKGKFKGFFKKAITVRSNASNSIVRVYVQGNMEVDD